MIVRAISDLRMMHAWLLTLPSQARFQFAGDILAARKLIFPGVGAYASAMEVLRRKGLIEPVKEYVQSGRSFLGICLGLQLLFDGSEENDGVEGLGIIPGRVAKFDTSLGLPVPHIGWNGKRIFLSPISIVL